MRAVLKFFGFVDDEINHVLGDFITMRDKLNALVSRKLDQIDGHKDEMNKVAALKAQAETDLSIARNALDFIGNVVPAPTATPQVAAK